MDLDDFKSHVNAIQDINSKINIYDLYTKKITCKQKSPSMVEIWEFIYSYGTCPKKRSLLSYPLSGKC